jgi:GTPase SAR1 family protein
MDSEDSEISFIKEKAYDPLMLFLQRISSENKRLFYLNDSISIAHIEALLTGQLSPHQLYDLAFWHLQSKDPDVYYILTDPKFMKDLFNNNIEKITQLLKAETERYRSYKFILIPLYLDGVHSLLVLNKINQSLTHYSIGANIEEI